MLSLRFNIYNWKNQTLPKRGDIVKFPESFANFGKERCASTDDDCDYGGNVLLRPPTDEDAVVGLNGIIAPENGIVRVLEGITVEFYDIDEAESEVEWHSQMPSDFDFRCGASWSVNGTGANPLFRVPCYMDIASYPDVSFAVDFQFLHCLICLRLQGETYMTVVPENTFVKQLISPVDNAFTTDPYQFSGWPIGVDPSQCRQPFSTKRGAMYCQALCLNTCPELHPDFNEGRRLQLDQNQTLADILVPAIADAKAVLSVITNGIHVSGSTKFPIPSDASDQAVDAVVNRIKSDLPKNYPYALNVTVSWCFLYHGQCASDFCMI